MSGMKQVKIKETGKITQGYPRFWDHLVKAGKAEYLGEEKTAQKEEKKPIETKEEKKTPATKRTSTAKK